jgi:hypothetical protein
MSTPGDLVQLAESYPPYLQRKELLKHHVSSRTPLTIQNDELELPLLHLVLLLPLPLPPLPLPLPLPPLPLPLPLPFFLLLLLLFLTFLSLISFQPTYFLLHLNFSIFGKNRRV